VRELANVIERAALLAESRQIVATDLDLPTAIGPPGPLGEPASLRDVVADLERARLQEALDATGWSLSRAARRLGMARNTLRFRVAKLGLVQSLAGPLARDTTALPVARSRLVVLLHVTVASSDAHAPGAVQTGPFDLLVTKTVAFGGQVLERGARGFLAAFGLEPDEDAPSHAAHAALAIRAAARRGAADEPTQRPLRFVLHAAPLPVGQPAGACLGVADPARAALDALSAEAEPYDIVVSDAVAPHLERRFSLAPLRPA
jgi:hypothetical protein